ncbi:leucine-rich repeat-containing protein 23-like [Photinus pyralis]|uniref:leucine-rich repeat-containing protein 23-like n=1 Tax=Photinus pyralis TaxID=7054 RepID=UPI0012673D13|nr:leucine-rich repeat-containing protein 23-like [Photinus pyralis]
MAHTKIRRCHTVQLEYDQLKTRLKKGVTKDDNVFSLDLQVPDGLLELVVAGWLTERNAESSPLAGGIRDNQIYLSQFESDRLEQLKQLELRGNFLTDLSGSYPASLEALYLAENRIKELTLSSADFRRLAVLHLRENYVRKLDGLGRADLPSLRYLNLRKNKITKFRQFRKLARLPKLETLIVLGNPFYGEEEKPGEDDEELGDEEEKEDIARIPLLVLLPQLKRINKGPVTVEEREEVAEVREEKLEEIMGEESSDDEMPTTTEYTTEEED